MTAIASNGTDNNGEAARRELDTSAPASDTPAPTRTLWKLVNKQVLSAVALCVLGGLLLFWLATSYWQAAFLKNASFIVSAALLMVATLIAALVAQESEQSAADETNQNLELLAQTLAQVAQAIVGVGFGTVIFAATREDGKFPTGADWLSVIFVAFVMFLSGQLFSERRREITRLRKRLNEFTGATAKAQAAFELAMKPLVERSSKIEELLKEWKKVGIEGRFAALLAEHLGYEIKQIERDPELIAALQAGLGSERAWLAAASALTNPEHQSAWLKLMAVYFQEESYDVQRFEVATNVRNYAFMLLALVESHLNRLRNDEEVVIASVSPFAPKDFINFPNGTKDARLHAELEFFGTYRRILGRVLRDDRVTVRRVLLAKKDDAKLEGVEWPVDALSKLENDSKFLMTIPVPVPFKLDGSPKCLTAAASTIDDAFKNAHEEMGMTAFGWCGKKNDWKNGGALASPRLNAVAANATELLRAPLLPDIWNSLTPTEGAWLQSAAEATGLKGWLEAHPSVREGQSGREKLQYVMDNTPDPQPVAEETCRVLQDYWQAEEKRAWAALRRECGLDACSECDRSPHALCASCRSRLGLVDVSAKELAYALINLTEELSRPEVLPLELAAAVQLFDAVSATTSDEAPFGINGLRLGVAEHWLHRWLIAQEAAKVTQWQPVRDFFLDQLCGVDSPQKGLERLRVVALDGNSLKYAQEKDIEREFMLIGTRKRTEKEHKIKWNAWIGATMAEPFHTCRVLVRFSDADGSDDLLNSHKDWLFHETDGWWNNKKCVEDTRNFLGLDANTPVKA